MHLRPAPKPNSFIASPEKGDPQMMNKPGVVVNTEIKDSGMKGIKRFDPYAQDLTADFFECLNNIINRYEGYPINKTTRDLIEHELRLLVSHVEMSGLMSPRMIVRNAYEGDHGAGKMVVELLDREMLPIRPRELGYVPQFV
jgi:hypothetical protein